MPGIFMVMYFLFDMTNYLLSCISLADNRHFHYFQGNCLLQSSFCFSVLLYFPVCFLLNLLQSSFCFYFLLYATLSQSMLPLSIFFFFPAFFSFSCCAVTTFSFSASILCCFRSSLPFFLYSLVSFLSHDLFFSNLLLYLFLIQYCFLLLLHCWFCW